MDISPANDPDVLRFPVEYQAITGTPNPDLRGKGILAIHPAGPTYRFTGDARAMFGRPTALEFAPDEIRNVNVVGRRIEFATAVGAAGRKRQPFVFYCASAEEAAGIAALLPAARDREFLSHHDFGRRLHQLPAATSTWGWVTHQIVALNVVAFVIMGLAGAGWLQPTNMSPYIRFAANNGGATTDGEWWRIVTAMFVHYGALHLALNMWALFQTGHFVERLFGRGLFALGYLGSGIIASFTSLYWHGDRIWSAGASGAVFGVYGLLLGFMAREKTSIPSAVLRPLFKSTLLFAGYNLVFGLVYPRIDNAAHLGGLVGGALLGWLLALPLDPAARAARSGGRLRLGVVVVLAGALLAGALAPRFPYRFREELRWGDTLEEPIARESALVEEQEQRIARLQPGQPEPALAGWLESEVIPFYERWRSEVMALDLTPGLRTEQRRRVLSELIDAKLADYRRLAADLRAGDAEAIRRFVAAEQTAMAKTRAPRE